MLPSVDSPPRSAGIIHENDKIVSRPARPRVMAVHRNSRGMLLA
jgi:hypothetical protein